MTKETVLPKAQTDVGGMQECLLLTVIMLSVIHEIFFFT
jgi:hypothetical protein